MTAPSVDPTADPSIDAVVDIVEGLTKPIQQFTRAWMLVKETNEYSKSLGFPTGKDFWIVGRGGVIGSATPETAVATLAFHAPELIIRAWNSVPDGMTHSGTSELYADLCTDWGERTLTAFDDERLEFLESCGRRIIDAAPSSLGAVFAGWRDMRRPESIHGRFALTTQVLREMRGAAHIAAVTAMGLTPLDAILASTNAPPRTGPGYAEMMGFSGPFRDPAEIRDVRIEADRVTDRALAPYFGVLAPDELVEFARLYAATRDAIDM